MIVSSLFHGEHFVSIAVSKETDCYYCCFPTNQEKRIGFRRKQAANGCEDVSFEKSQPSFARGGSLMNKEVVDRLLEVAAQAAPQIEVAVSGVKDKQLRGVIAGVIMQRILQEVGQDEGRNVAAAGSNVIDLRDAGRKAGTQARILNLQSDNFFRDPRRLEQVLEELRIRGFHHNKSDVRMSLLRLARKKSLRRIPLGEGRQRMYLYVDP